ncbi:stage II sporulation protein P [Marininema mesophilum]|uniref:Stage II sporulation protein P n=1 Tax=Marininema mesophilum TaxID=1048340 RepID=A0A1H2R8R1_9BACL|nr:stage II sporulation protein P [Marininema mesophilum]SDW15863.1 stage II sporulation protein P [Marininema mesophilum]
MRKRVRGFKAFNMSAPQVRQLFVALILGTAIMFVLTGLFAVVQAKRSAQSGDISQITARFSTETLLYLMGGEVPYLSTMKEVASKELSISRITFELMTSIDPKDPRSLFGSELPGFALFDTQIVVAGKDVDYTDVPIESTPPSDLEKKLTEDKKKKPEKEEPPPRRVSGKERVFIYHTHYTESYLPELKNTDHPKSAYDQRNNITKVGRHMGETLDRYGLGTQVYSGGFNAGWNQLYRASRAKVVSALKANKDLSYVIDIHRDSQHRAKTTTDIKGKKYSRIAFVIGTGNPHWEDNERFARQLHKKLDELYPGLSKGVFRKTPMMGNGEYNQSLSKKGILVEIGGVDNTFNESNRSADALARALADVHFGNTPVATKSKENKSPK